MKQLLTVLLAAFLSAGFFPQCSQSEVDTSLARLQAALIAAPNDDAYLLAQETLSLSHTVSPYAPEMLSRWITALEHAIFYGADPAITEMIVEHIRALADSGMNPAVIRLWLMSNTSRTYIEQLPPHLQDMLTSIVPLIQNAPTAP